MKLLHFLASRYRHSVLISFLIGAVFVLALSPKVEAKRLVENTQVLFFGNIFTQFQDYLAPYQDTFATLLIDLVYIVVFTIVFLFVLKFGSYYYKKLYRKSYRFLRQKLPSVKLQELELVNKNSIKSYFIIVVGAIRFLVAALLTYIYLSFVLNLFSWSQRLGSLLLQVTLDFLKQATLIILGYIPKLFVIILIVIISYGVIRLSRKIFKEIANGKITIPGFYPAWATPTANLLSIGIIAFATVSIFPYLPGGNSPALQGVSIFVGLLFSLGSTAVVGNLVSGIVLIYTRAFSKGDRVTIGGITGDVIDDALLVTRIRTTKNKIVTIPNGMVLGGYIINFSDTSKSDSAPPLIVNLTITLGYDVPWRKVHKVLLAAANETNDVLHDPSPFILQTALNDFYVCYELNASTNQPLKIELIKSSLHQKIQDKCNENDIEILSPHYQALRDGNMTTIPAEYLAKDYVAPPFQLTVDPQQINNIE